MSMTRADRLSHTGTFVSDTSPRALTLDRLTADAMDVRGVWARDVRAGDWIVVHTRNSVYSLAVLGDGTYAAAGGWFATSGAEARPVRVSGCTWGGHAILTGMVAAPGMCIEFANGVRTTRIREVQLIRNDDSTRH